MKCNDSIVEIRNTSFFSLFGVEIAAVIKFGHACLTPHLAGCLLRSIESSPHSIMEGSPALCSPMNSY
ncbi:hypothetical protein AB3S75_005599 [Citrus x aurantiifolia]